jgi:hypothetical protein
MVGKMTTRTTRREVELFCEALQSAVPLLTQWAPDGWVDFRNGAPANLRAGLMVKLGACEDVVPHDTYITMPAKPRTMLMAQPLEFRAMFGGELAAQAVVNRLSDLLPTAAWTTHPKIEAPEPGGGSTLWIVEFSIHPNLLAELTAIVSPPPARNWR